MQSPLVQLARARSSLIGFLGLSGSLFGGPLVGILAPVLVTAATEGLDWLLSLYLSYLLLLLLFLSFGYLSRGYLSPWNCLLLNPLMALLKTLCLSGMIPLAMYLASTLLISPANRSPA